MGKIDRRYIKNVTEVNMIINMLSEKEKEKIPQNVKKFFEDNSDANLIETIEIKPDLSGLSFTTRKLLKVIDFYLNKKQG